MLALFDSKMPIDEIVTLRLLANRPSYRKVEMCWNRAAKPQNYKRLTAREEYVEAKGKAHLEINGHSWVLNEAAKDSLDSIIDTIYKDSVLKASVSKSTISLAVLKELKCALLRRARDSKSKTMFSDALHRIEISLDKQIDSFEFLFPVEGISLKEIIKVDGGRVELFLCSPSICNQLASNFLKERTSANSDIYDMRRAAFEKDFLNRILIKSIAYGDAEVAEKKAYRQAREFINYLRFALCFLIHERVTEQIVRINFSVEANTQGELFLSRKLSEAQIIKTRGRGRDFLQKFVIDQKRLRNLSKDGFLTDFTSIVSSSSPTEIELLILAAIHWVGEAQNEFDFDVAFVKYWTAIETIFTGHQNPTQAVVRGISRLNAFSHYKFVEQTAINEIEADVSKLYDKRADIIHRGMRHVEEAGQGVSASDVSRLCKYAVWSIFSLFELRCLRYTTRSELTRRIDKVHPPSLSEDIIDAARRLSPNYKTRQPLRCQHSISDRWKPIAKP